MIIADIIERFNLPKESCLEFGVEFGFSTVAFSSYFENVKGVDIFTGDKHTVHKENHFETTKRDLEPYSNIQLFRADYKDWIKQDKAQYGLIHVDIVHTYKDTYDCGLWSAQHSKCAIFHDTESFIGVRRAVIDIAKAAGKNVYNYPHCNGLGIIV
ncbi:MAG TPA: class I SAM-dependent methyltransferase [Candidatus Saccharimonadales bacterium]|nr:class I SAM-dependent methyltransferase [Candidatus Saccharimonadales bacterium]